MIPELIRIEVGYYSNRGVLITCLIFLANNWDAIDAVINLLFITS